MQKQITKKGNYGLYFEVEFQQRESAVFTKDVDEGYDAYDKDIAVASFFFKKHTMFQYRK